MRRAIPDSLKRWLGMGGRAYFALHAQAGDGRVGEVVGYILAYNRGGARSIAQRSAVKLGRQMLQRDMVDAVAAQLPEIGGKVKAGSAVPDALRGWRVEEIERNDMTGQRSVRVYDDAGELRSSRSGTRATDAEILADAGRDAGVTSSVRRHVRTNPGFDGSKRQFFPVVKRPAQTRCEALAQFIDAKGRRFCAAHVPRGETVTAYKGAGNCDAGWGVVSRNPAVMVLGNPGKRGSGKRRVLSNRAIAIQYVHAADGKSYSHKFGKDDTIELMPDGSFRVYNRRGKNLWKDFL